MSADHDVSTDPNTYREFREDVLNNRMSPSSNASDNHTAQFLNHLETSEQEPNLKLCSLMEAKNERNEQPQQNQKQEMLSFNGNRYVLIFKLAIPAVLNNMTRHMFVLVNLYFIGKLGNPAMVAGAGLGSMTFNILGLAFVLGFNGVLDTLISQAAGAGNLEQCGILLHRGQFFVVLLFIPIIIVNLYAEDLLLLIKQHAEVAKYAQQYILAFLPALFFQGLGDCVIKLLNNLGKTQIPCVCTLVGIVIHYFASRYFVIGCGYGLYGTGLALCVTYFAIYVSMIVWACTQADIQRAMFLPDKRVFENLKEHAKMGVPYTLMLVLDQWVWEFMILIAGFFTIPEQASMIITMTIICICYQIGMGLEQTSCAIIGNLIGANNCLEAKQYYRALLIVSSALCCLCTVILNVFEEPILKTFTADPKLLTISRNLVYLVCLGTIPDCFKGMMKGVIKALCAQDTCVKINLVGHWIINLSLQYILPFYLGMRLKGMWIAKCTLEFFLFFAYACLINSLDWREVTRVVQERLEQEESQRQSSGKGAVTECLLGSTAGCEDKESMHVKEGASISNVE